jgi:hypothetical protein
MRMELTRYFDESGGPFCTERNNHTCNRCVSLFHLAALAVLLTQCKVNLVQTLRMTLC